MELLLDTPLVSLRGIPYLNANETAMTVKDALLEQIGSYRARTGAETIRIYALGQKVLAAHELVLSDEEVGLIKSTFDQQGLPAAIAGFVMGLLNKGS